MTKAQEALLELVRIALTERCVFSPVLTEADGNEVLALAGRQGVSCLCMKALEVLHKYEVRLWNTELKLQLYARQQQVMASAKKHFDKAVRFAEEVAPLRLAALKGIDYAQYWPNPLWREFGDLDVVVVESGELKGESSKLSRHLDKKCRELGYDVDDHDYKHTEIRCNGIMVENHHFFTCFGGSKGATKQEEMLQRMFNGEFRPIGETKMLSPNVNFTAYFLLAHAQNHFFYEGMSLRQILDWHFFLQKEGGDVDWSVLKPVLEETELKPFAVLMTQICNKYFNLRCNVFNTGSVCKAELMEKFLIDIFSEQFNRERKLLPMIERLTHRFIRTVKFKELNKMSVPISVWRWFAFTSYLNRRPKLKK